MADIDERALRIEALGLPPDLAIECACRIGDTPVIVGSSVWVEDRHGALLAVIPERILDAGKTRRQKGAPDVILMRGKVDARSEHVELCAGHRVLARLVPNDPAQPEEGHFLIDWLVPRNHRKAKEWTRQFMALLEGLLTGKGEEKPWCHLRSHCRTTADAPCVEWRCVFRPHATGSTASGTKIPGLTRDWIVPTANPGSTSAVKKKRPSKRPPPDPSTLFRGWLAGRIMGNFDADGSGRESSGGETFPRLAWLVFSSLAAEGADKLGEELRRAFRIFYDDLDQLGWLLSGSITHRETPRYSKEFLAALDGILPLITVRPAHLKALRAMETDSNDLLLQAGCDEVGSPLRAEFLMRRFYKLDPEEEAIDARGEGFFASMMQNACEAVEVLERFQEKYPKAAAWVARYRDRWPVLHRKGERGNAAFRSLAERIQLGEDYPLDPAAKVHAVRQNSLRSFLTPVVEWLVRVWAALLTTSPESRVLSAIDCLRRRRHPWDLPVGHGPAAAAEVLVAGADLPPLTKSTATRWARELVVPFIMATDAAEIKSLKQPALRAIWKQAGVKSVKSFRSRLLDAVRKELPRMARK